MADSVKIKIDGDDSGFRKALSGVGSVAGTILKGVGAATVATGAAVAALSKAVVSAYAENEQLVGGVETIFKTSSAKLISYANNAYKTAGLSANEYMTSVTSFSASLLQSLGGDTEKATEAANSIMTDMSDNANKYGTGIESVNNAYQGFAKQNFTMLDNLKLGYGGTREEMQRLLDDASALSGVDYDISSYADIAEAIHVVQTEMGITGTTAKEATETISGSMGMLKGAVSNLITGLGDSSADMDTLVSNVVESFGYVVKNITPVLQNVASQLPAVFTALAEALGAMLPTLLASAGQIFAQLITSIIGLLPELIPVVSEAFTLVIEAIVENLPMLADAAIEIIGALGEALIENLPLLAESALQIILSLALGIADALPELIPTLVNVMLQIVQTLIDNVDLLTDAAIQLMIGLTEGLLEALPILIDQLPTLIISLVNALIDNAPKLLVVGYQLMVALVQGLINSIPQMLIAAAKILQQLKQSFADAWESFKTIGGDIVRGIWAGISNAGDWLYGKLKTWVSNVVQWIKDFLGISSPSKLFRDEIGRFIGEGLAIGITATASDVQAALAGITDPSTVGGAVTSAYSAGQSGSRSTTNNSYGGDTYNVYAQKATPSEIFAEARYQRERRAMTVVPT